jgi:hypothetical protein
MPPASHAFAASAASQEPSGLLAAASSHPAIRPGNRAEELFQILCCDLSAAASGDPFIVGGLFAPWQIAAVYGARARGD